MFLWQSQCKTALRTVFYTDAATCTCQTVDGRFFPLRLWDALFFFTEVIQNSTFGTELSAKTAAYTDAMVDFMTLLQFS